MSSDIHVKRYLLAIVFDLATLLCSNYSTAQVIPINLVDKSGRLEAKWVIKKKHGNTNIQIEDKSEHPALNFICKASSFSIEQSINIDLNSYPYLSWEWYASKLPKNGNLQHHDTNDQVIQVFIVFGKTLFGFDAISYVWDTNAPIQTYAEENWKFLGIGFDVKVLVIESGYQNLNQWIQVRRNIKEDIEHLFGYFPEEIVGIRIQTNCQHTKSSANGLIRNIRFSRN